MTQCDPSEKCEWCGEAFVIDMNKRLHGTMCLSRYLYHLACVLAFFVGLYEASVHERSYQKGLDVGFERAVEACGKEWGGNEFA